jgi:hypothetical protein
MRRNPAGDWRVRDLEVLGRRHQFRVSPPSGDGSHFKVSHPSLPEILTIPSRNPLKPVYVRMLVKFVDRLKEAP